MIYRVKQSSGICPHCSIHQSKRDSDSDSSSSDNSIKGHGNHRIVIPLGKKVINQNQNIEKTLSLLQDQVERLKEQNFDKEGMIKRLQMELTKQYAPENFEFSGKSQISNRAYHHPPSVYTSKNTDSVYPGKELQEYLSGRKHMNNIDDSHLEYKMEKKGSNLYKKGSAQRKTFKSVSPTKALHQIETRMKQVSNVKNQRIEILGAEIQQQAIIINQLQERLKQQLDDNEWMTRFCISFIRMSTQIARTQGHKITDPVWSVRKNARYSWKYFKQFVHEVIY